MKVEKKKISNINFNSDRTYERSLNRSAFKNRKLEAKTRQPTRASDESQLLCNRSVTIV